MKTSQITLSTIMIGGLLSISACNSRTVAENRGDVPAPLDRPIPTTTVAAAPLTTTSRTTTFLTQHDPVTGTEIGGNTHVITGTDFGNVPNEPVSDIPKFQLAPTETVVYTVKKGDSLWSIGHMYGVTANELAAVNNLSAQKVLRVGQSITIPPGGAYLPPEKRKKIVVKTPKTTTTKTTSKTITTPTAPVAGGTYSVVAGDYPEKIAKKHGITTKALLQANNLTEKSVLQINQKLVIPGTAATTTTTTTVEQPGGTTTTTTTTDPAGVDVPLIPVVDPGPANPTISTDPVDPGILSESIDAEAGESLESMATTFLIPLDTLKKLNPGIDPKAPLPAGTLVKVPVGN